MDTETRCFHRQSTSDTWTFRENSRDWLSNINEPVVDSVSPNVDADSRTKSAPTFYEYSSTVKVFKNEILESYNTRHRLKNETIAKFD